MTAVSISPRRSTEVVFAILFIAFTAASLDAADVIRKRGSTQGVSGEIKSMSKTEVTITSSTGDEVKVPVSEIADITWDDEPADAKQARSDENGGRLERAIESYKKAIDDPGEIREMVKAELRYAITRCTVKIAINDLAKADAAAKAMESFVNGAGDDSWQFYSAVGLLAELYVAKKDYIKATATFGRLAKSPSRDQQMVAKVGLGRIAAAENKPIEAVAAYNEVIAMTAEKPGEVSQRHAAMLGKASLLISQSQFDEALKLTDEVLAAVDREDFQVQAEAYLRQGDCYQALNKNREAVLSYLAVDILCSAVKPQHAEALYNLVRLWPKVNHLSRAADARERLESEYPNSPWTRQLQSGGGS